MYLSSTCEVNSQFPSCWQSRPDWTTAHFWTLPGLRSLQSALKTHIKTAGITGRASSPRDSQMYASVNMCNISKTKQMTHHPRKCSGVPPKYTERLKSQREKAVIKSATSLFIRSFTVQGLGLGLGVEAGVWGDGSHFRVFLLQQEGGKHLIKGQQEVTWRLSTSSDKL